MLKMAMAGVLTLLAATAAGAQPPPSGAPVAPMRADALEPRLVEIEPGRRLNLRCFGSGSPTVVFEQGGEGMIYNWSRVFPAIEALTRTCVYDRGGLGWSDPPRYPVTALSVTDDLHALLAKAGEKGPFVLVGHSIGGFYATMYADRFLDEVAGLVLVDPGYSGQVSGTTGARWDLDQANVRRGEGGVLRCAELARRGRLTPEALAPNGCYAPPPASAGEAARRYALNAVLRPHWYDVVHSQSVHYFSADPDLSVSHRQERDAARAFGDLPMVVLSAERFTGDPWRTDEENLAFQQLWLAGHRELAKRSTRARYERIPAATIK